MYCARIPTGEITFSFGVLSVIGSLVYLLAVPAGSFALLRAAYGLRQPLKFSHALRDEADVRKGNIFAPVYIHVNTFSSGFRG